MDLNTLQDQIRSCNCCRLGQTRTNLVFGRGNPEASIMLIGEAPGQNEDLTGQPFVGQAGKLLDRFLRQAEIADFYIANILKCRPPENRDPLPDEIAKCYPYVQQQIEIIRPKVLIALGRYAASRLSLQFGDMASLLKSNLEFEYADGSKIPIVPIYHPAYLLRAARGTRPKAQALFQNTLTRFIAAKSLAGL